MPNSQIIIRKKVKKKIMVEAMVRAFASRNIPTAASTGALIVSSRSPEGTVPVNIEVIQEQVMANDN